MLSGHVGWCMQHSWPDASNINCLMGILPYSLVGHQACHHTTMAGACKSKARDTAGAHSRRENSTTERLNSSAGGHSNSSGHMSQVLLWLITPGVIPVGEGGG